MNRTLPIVAPALLVLLSGPTAAHRLDEYLQATVISLEKDRVEASLRLTPGVAVSATVLAAVDANSDGAINDGEQRAYAQRVLHDLSLTVDGTVGYVSGLCVSSKWQGNATRGVEPWRDTGIEIRGPAVADIERAFTQTWAAAAGDDVDALDVALVEDAQPVGDVLVRVLASQPTTAGITASTR